MYDTFLTIEPYINYAQLTNKLSKIMFLSCPGLGLLYISPIPIKLLR